MKTCRKIINISLAIIGLMIVSANYSFSQDEYDDMYFRPDDRKEVKLSDVNLKGNNTTEGIENKTIAKNTTSDVINPSYSPGDYGNLEENYSVKNVNPEYIARYKSNPKDAESSEELAEGDSYYDEYYDRTLMPGEGVESKGSKYNYPSSYYGGYNAMMRNSMYRNPWYDPFYSGGFGPSWSLGLGYSFGYMPGLSMSFGYGNGWGYNPYGFYDPWGYGYSPYMSSFYDPFYSPWSYDPFYSPWRYNSMYSYRYGYGGYPYYCYPSYGFYSGYSVAYVTNSGTKVVTKGTESNGLATPAYRNRVSRGSEQISRENLSQTTSRNIARRGSNSETQTLTNARTAADRDFSRSQNEYYSRNGSRNSSTSSNITTNPAARTAATSPDRSTSSTYRHGNTVRVRSTRTNTDYSRPSYQTTRQERTLSSGTSRHSSWSNSGTYRSSRSSGSSYTPSRSSGGSFSGSSGASFRSSSGSSSSGSFSGGSRSSGSSSGSSRSSRGNR